MFQRFGWFFLACALVWLIAGPCDGSPGERRVAVVIGLNDYMEQVSPLHCAVNDARQMKKMLVECLGFAPDDVIVMTTEDRGNGLPTNANIKQTVKNLKSRLGPRDTLMFFFSGHGVEMDGQSYLLTFEANPYSEEALKASCLPVAELGADLQQMRTAHSVVFMDACRQDPRVKPQPGPQMYDPNTPQPSAAPDGKPNARSVSFAKDLVIVRSDGGSAPSAAVGNVTVPGANHAACFFSCSLGQRSYEWPEQGMGFFTYYLVSGIRKEIAADPKGRLTIPSLHDFLETKVPPAVESRFQYRQKPTLQQVNEMLASDWMFREGTMPVKPPADIAPPEQKGPIRKRDRGTRLTYALDIVSNNVEGREMNILTHRIEDHFYEIDNESLRKLVAEKLNATGELTPAASEADADLFIYFNVCPTRNMMIDLLARDRESRIVVLRQNEELRRPYPGNKKQLVETPVKVLETKVLKNLVTSLERAYRP